MSKKISIYWFRQDLRLADNPALTEAVIRGQVLPIYILDDIHSGEYAMGEASRWWLYHSLQKLNKSLGGMLSIYKGDPKQILADIIKRFDVEALYWNRCYEPWRIQRDASLKNHFTSEGYLVKTYNGSLLCEPWDIQKEDGTPYKVFTPFYRKGILRAHEPRVPLPKPENIDCIFDPQQVGVDALELLPNNPWDKKLAPHWEIGEQAAIDQFRTFINVGLSSYKDGRNFPAKPSVSRMSPRLHFGEISPNQLWYMARATGVDKHVDHFCSELGWREFSYSQLYHNPNLPRQNLQPKFDGFPWIENEKHLRAWQKGQTGIPMVDAGMRELWQTGYLHNRVRMIVGSFLVKNLRIHWHQGERWFWNTLVDADLANNSASWQWIAGCGADAAPYFRIFNPITQGQKFDPDGTYVRQYIPEIASLPDRYLFNPWEAPETVLKEAAIKLGDTYPHPIIDLRQSREDALEAFQSLKQGKA
ncbi:MAG: deoxyribodipyrimidine photo-lyase [Pseudomonadota bacterium]|nr:deoxyribodipyrimidine photo-lyase [Pseudomonadota bacterium]